MQKMCSITDVDTERRSRSGTRAGIVLETLVIFFASQARPKGSLRVGRAGPGRCPGYYDPPTNPKPVVRASKRNVVPRGGRGSGDGCTGWGRARRRRARAAPRLGSRSGGGERYAIRKSFQELFCALKRFVIGCCQFVGLYVRRQPMRIACEASARPAQALHS